ncbi:MAG: oxygen-dependent coproporphyrinogen oxidase [Balneolales bacterium]
MSIKKSFTDWLFDLQDRICTALEETDGQAEFLEDHWKREGGGGGRSRVIEKGRVFEKGGVNVSTVHGELPELIRKRFGVNEGWFYACGISLVLHPESPMIPAVHSNFRYFELYNNKGGKMVDAWFGGGADLTPFYLFEEDVRHFHRTFRAVCDNHHPELYPRFKKACDSYFYNEHRGETRGVGGLFFDYLRAEKEQNLDFWHKLTTSCGDAFLSGYLPVVERRKEEPWGEEERYFQELRRGRYVEFNLVYDRGTLFGLKTGGRTESVLMSLPPRVRWDYNVQPKPGSREEELLEVLKNPREWV